MAKPFTSKDGADAAGIRAEVWVQVGTGTITGLEHANDANKQNVMVQIKSDNAAVKKPIKGWLAKSDPIYSEVVAAHSSGRDVQYRIEAQRKGGVDRSTPIADLRTSTEVAAENTISIFAGLDGHPSKEAVTNPAEDPMPGGRISAASAPSAPSSTPSPTGAAAGAPASFSIEAALTGLSTARSAGLPSGVVDAAAALALAAGATARQVAEAGFTAQAAASRSGVRRSFAREAAPHVAANSDGRTNLGSFAVQAAFSAEHVAFGILSEAERVTFEEHNAAVAAGTLADEPLAAPGPVNLDQAASLGGILLSLADRVQVGAYGGGRADRMANSHTRARSLVYDAVRTRYPVPFEADAARKQEWMDQIVAEGVHRFTLLSEIAAQVTEFAPQDADEATGETSAAHSASQGGGRAQAAQQTQQSPRGGADTTHFQAPSPEVIDRFRVLASAAGFSATPDSPVVAYLASTLGVRAIRQAHGPAVEALVARFEAEADSAMAFRVAVLSQASQDQAPQDQAAA